jgi:Kef-type K+ transport system membrane component KefB
VLLFFFIGLGLNLRSFRSNLKEGALISLFNTVLPFILGLAVASYIGASMLVGVVLGIALAVSSQTVTFDLLEEFGLLKSRIGSLIVGARALDDIIEFILISFLLTVIQLEAAASLLTIVINLLAFVGIMSIFKLSIIPWLLKIFEKQKSPRALLMGALIITTLMATLAGLLGLSGLIGAFVAGAIVRQVLLTGEHPRPWEEHEMAKSIDTLSFGVFIPIFFVYVGLAVDLSTFENVELGLALLSSP